MAKTGAYQPIVCRGPQTPLIPYPEAASLDIKKGSLVLIDSDGRVDACGSDPSLIFGIAANDSANGLAGANELLVEPILPGVLYEISLLETLAQTQMNEAAGVVKDGTTGLWYASTANNSDQTKIYDYVKGPGGWDIGDTKARVFVIFDDANLQHGS